MKWRRFNRRIRSRKFTVKIFFLISKFLTSLFYCRTFCLLILILLCYWSFSFPERSLTLSPMFKWCPWLSSCILTHLAFALSILSIWFFYHLFFLVFGLMSWTSHYSLINMWYLILDADARIFKYVHKVRILHLRRKLVLNY